MRGYELYKIFQGLAPKEQDYAVGYFLGGVGMLAEGFTTPHRHQEKAVFAMNEFEDAMKKSEEIDLSNPEADPLVISAERVSSYESKETHKPYEGGLSHRERAELIGFFPAGGQSIDKTGQKMWSQGQVDCIRKVMKERAAKNTLVRFSHTLYTREDKDAPLLIKDPNGDIVLQLCKVCGRGEAELDTICPGFKNGLNPNEAIVSTEKETVNHPSHYNQGKIEVIDAIEDWKLDFSEGCVVKYLARHRHKNGLEDLKKARWYLNRLIENLEKKEQDDV